MDNFDRVLIVVIIICISVLTGIVSTTIAIDFTCEQMDKVYSEGQCVNLALEDNANANNNVK